MQLTQEQIISQIEFTARGRSNKDITKLILEEWRNGDKAYLIKDMLDAQEYYMCRNITIQSKNRDYIDGDGNKQINTTLSNKKITSAHVRTGVLQKVNYAVGKPFTIEVAGETDEEDAARELYLSEWLKWVTPDVRKTIKRITTNAVNKGIGWAHVTINNGQLVIDDAEPEQFYPAWADKAHTELDAIVRDYVVVIYENMERKEVVKVEYWDKEVVERYIEKDGELVPDPDYKPVAGHLERPISGSNGEPTDLQEEISWGKVPFIALKGNDDELPQLNVIRSHVDAYDALQSKSIDALLDGIEPVLIIEGISPELNTLQKIRTAVQNNRIASIDIGGKAYYVQTNPNITAVEAMLNILEKDIRHFGQMIISQEGDTTSNPSGVALKFRYQDLDTYTDGFEPNFETFMHQLKYFFDRWLAFRGVGTVEQWERYKLIVTLDRDMMINESQIIDDTLKLMGANLSQETIDGYNPAVESHAIEQARREKEQERALRDTRMLRKIAELQEDSEA